MIITCPDRVRLILGLSGVIVYPLGTGGTSPKIVCGSNPFTARGTEIKGERDIRRTLLLYPYQ